MDTLDTKQSGRAIHPCVIELREMLKSVLGDDFVRLYHYGSRVVGGAGPDSDYDVLCITKRPLSRRQRDEMLDRQIDLQLAHDVFIDLHFYSDEELPYSSHLFYSLRAACDFRGHRCMTFSEDERRQLAAMRMARADAVLADASILADRGSGLSAINRCYYAMFYAASALAIHDNCDFHKHRAVISWFNREYVNAGRFSRETGKSFRVAFDKRCDADYTDVSSFTADQVAAMLEQAKQFVAEVKSLLQAT